MAEQETGEVFKALIAASGDLASKLRPEVSQPHSYEFPSQQAAREAEIAMYHWKLSGAGGLPPNLSKADFRAAIYDMARACAQLRAYGSVAPLAILEHIELASRSLQSGSLLMGLICVRGALERIGALSENTRKLKNHFGDGKIEFEAVLEASEIVLRTLYSTRLNWPAIATKDLRSSKSSDISYEKKDLVADVSAKSVMSMIDALDKKVPGARVSYDILCEFLHPNVGDLVSFTVDSESFYDRWDTRHLRRVVCAGPANLEKQHDYAAVFMQVSSIAADILRLVPGLLADLSTISAKVANATRKAQHKTVRQNRDLFLRADPCPCLSGKQIRHCAPMALKA